MADAAKPKPGRTWTQQGEGSPDSPHESKSDDGWMLLYDGRCRSLAG